ncbi:GT-D fold domain-containing glycosyltransferase [Spiribacter onubensis]|uniref:GT-D fold domain-containing glycosyltransferase n=1 Tax=Spiribacter onubensis TaxID=3122420 RepID=A0ABV3SBI7_9GAMM
MVVKVNKIISTAGRLRLKFSSRVWRRAIIRFLKYGGLSLDLSLIKDEELINRISRKKESFIRWGDGETALIFQQSLPFQEYNPNLADCLIQLLDHRYRKANKVLLGVPEMAVKKNMYKALPLRKKRLWFDTRILLNGLFNGVQALGDAFLFRPESAIDKEKIGRLWSNKNLVLVSSDFQHFFYFEKLYSFKSLIHVKVPPANAYFVVEETEKEIFRLIATAKNSADTMVLIAAGPGGKALGCRLVSRGVQVIDIGNFVTWKLKQ